MYIQQHQQQPKENQIYTIFSHSGFVAGT